MVNSKHKKVNRCAGKEETRCQGGCSVAQSCLTLRNPMDCRVPGIPLLHHLPELAQTQSIESVMPSNYLILCCPFSSCLESFPASGSFLMSRLFASGGQSIRASASASVLPMNIQGCFPSGLTGLISLQGCQGGASP